MIGTAVALGIILVGGSALIRPNGTSKPKTDRVKRFMDMVATAFQCNLTKVASVSFGYPGGGDAGGLRTPWLGFTDPLHFISHHGGNATKLDNYAKMSTWIAGQIAGLMDRLAAIPSASGTGTLLDETTIYWFNRHGDGDSESLTCAATIACPEDRTLWATLGNPCEAIQAIGLPGD